MPHVAQGRWFEPSEMMQAARSLMSEVSEACDRVGGHASRDRYSERQLAKLNTTTILFLIAALAFMGAVMFIPEFLPGDWLAKDNNLHQVVKYILLVVPIGFGFTAKRRLRRASKRTDVHDGCIEQLTSEFPQLRDARRTPVTGPSVNVLPRLTTGCKPLLRCSLFGEYRDHPLAMFEAEYVAPARLDALQLLDQAQANLLKDTDKEQFSRMRTAETIVFFRPQPQLPDLFLSGTQEPLCGHQARWVKEAGGDPRQSQLANLGSRFAGFSSCPAAASHLLTPKLGELLMLRPSALVQIIGGFMVVVPRSWSSATPMGTATQAFEIQLDLDFACAVYDALATPLNASPTSTADPSHGTDPQPLPVS